MSSDAPMPVLKTTQPNPTLNPSPTYVAVPNLTPTTPKTSRNLRRFKYLMRGLAKLIMDIFVGLGLLLIYGIPGVILVSLGIVFFIGLPLALGAAYGAVGILIGNGILRAAHLEHYTNNASAAAIGATGAIIASMAVGLLLQCLCIKTDEEHPAPWYISMSTTVVVHTLSGAIGTAILRRHHVDLGGIDVLHATRAGALGGAILGPGSIVIVPVVFAALGILLTPLWLAMMMGLKWVHVHSKESWDGMTYKSSYCVTYGTCGHDEEIENELAQIPHRGRLMFD
ncbi:hypothetical protein CVT25_008534 [Psilocybe cyanescens]|uniref:Uncharacterized protein n=1 Tax=Psilocybe cyanescens TaxID=93625 RepID=A0A409X9V2_PSICY|nr:hypothetical protein CVT25_008534 [Psilocybe cyanescens]